MRNPFKPRRRYLTDELSWQALLSRLGKRNVVLTEHGAWMQVIKFRGLDMDYRNAEDRFRLTTRFNAAFLQFGTGHAMWVEEQHVPFTTYPDTATDCPAARLFEMERQWLFREAGRHFVTETFLVVLYRPPASWLNKLTRMLVDYDPDDEADEYGHELDAFTNRVHRLVGQMTFLHEARILEDGELLTFLHSTISTKIQKVGDMGWDDWLPGSLVDQPFTGGMRPTLGHAHEKHDLFAISVHNYPRWVEGSLLRALRDIGVRYRRVTRWYPQDRQDSDKEIKRAWTKAAMARKPLGVQFLETVPGSTGSASSRVDMTADKLMQDAEDAEVELSEGTVRRGYMTNVIIVMVPSGDNGLQLAREVERLVMNAGLVCEIESFNATETVLGTIPGNLFHDVTRHGVNSAAAAALMPMDAPWTGSPIDPHSKTPALMTVTRGGCTPFHLNLTVGDVQHFFMGGWTGAGKSTLLNALKLAHRARHPNGQIVTIDKGGSSKVITLALGGRLIDFSDNRTAIQPLRFLETKHDRAWAAQWVIGRVFDADSAKAMDPEVQESISEAIDSFKETVLPDERDITRFSATVQDFWLKQALRPYTRVGEYGHIFDGVDPRTFDDDVVTFELGGVLRLKQAVPALVEFLFHTVERRADPDRPMMFTADEAWAYLKPPFSDRLEESLREMRRNNIQVGFATQSVADGVNSAAASVVMGSCKSKIYLPDPEALQPQSAAILEDLGLRHSEIEALASATPKKQYMLQQAPFEGSPGGVAIFDTTLGPLALTLCATTSSADQRRADKVRAHWGDRDFLYGWLIENGLPDAADIIGKPFAEAAE